LRGFDSVVCRFFDELRQLCVLSILSESVYVCHVNTRLCQEPMVGTAYLSVNQSGSFIENC